MTARRNIAILIGFVLSASLLSASVTAALLERYYGRAYMQTLGQICEGVIERLADSLTDSAAYLPDNKQETNRPNISSQSNEHQSNAHHSNEYQNNSLHTNRQTALYQSEQAVLTCFDRTELPSFLWLSANRFFAGCRHRRQAFYLEWIRGGHPFISGVFFSFAQKSDQAGQ